MLGARRSPAPLTQMLSAAERLLQEGEEEKCVCVCQVPFAAEKVWEDEQKMLTEGGS